MALTPDTDSVVRDAEERCVLSVSYCCSGTEDHPQLQEKLLSCRLG